MKFYFDTVPIQYPYRIYALSIHYPYSIYSVDRDECFQNRDFFWSSSGQLLVCFIKTKRRVKEALERDKRIPDFGTGLPSF